MFSHSPSVSEKTPIDTPSSGMQELKIKRNKNNFFIIIDLWLIILKHKKKTEKSQIQELTEQTTASLHLLH